MSGLSISAQKNRNPEDSPTALQQLLKTIEELPPLPGVAIQALESSLKDDISLTELVKIIESDPSITAKILRMANKPCFNRSHKTSTVQQAVALLGLTSLRCCLLSLISQDYLLSSGQETLDLQEKIWSHSLACAVAAQLIAERTYPELRKEAFAAGILHDLGKITILNSNPELYAQKLLDKNSMLSKLELEQGYLCCTHPQVGKWLAKKWNLPSNLTDCLFYHHHPINSLNYLNLNHELIYIVILANQLAHEYFLDSSSHPFSKKDQDNLINLLQLERSELEEIRYKIPELYIQRAHIFNLEQDLNSFYYPIIQKANQTLGTISLQLDEQNLKLEKINQVQRINSSLGLLLPKAISSEDLFYQVSETFRTWNRFYAGVIYVIDSENRILEGRLWLNRDKNKKLICFLDSLSQPIWDGNTKDLPKGLRELLSNYKSRMNYQAPLSEHFNEIYYKHPFYILPLSSNFQNILGEFCLAANHDSPPLTAEESTALRQSAGIIVANLEKLKIQENLEVRTEELSLALWKNQQIQQELVQAERLAAVGQLAAGAAHEINNPLAIINARAQLMQLKEQDPKKLEHLNLITDQISRISNILNNLMDFAKPAPPDLTDVDLNNILEKVSNLIRPSIKKLNITIQSSLDPTPPIIKADAKQLEQVFLNLILNAQHAMEKSGGTLSIETSLMAEKGMAEVKISDQGHGIPEKDLNKIFDPFFSTKEPGKGTGLGLSTSLSIIESHYGKIQFTSIENKGTTVSLKLPINLENLKPEAKEDLDTHKGPSQNKKQHILVVDDEKHIQDILKETLTSEGMEVSSCSNGQAALEEIQKNHFDLLLLDMRMPILDGLSLIKTINKEDKNLPIIVITGLATHEEMEEALAKGVSKCVRKPFHIKALIRDIYDTLQS